MARRSRLIARASWALIGGALLVMLLSALYLAADAEGLGAGFAIYYPYVFAGASAALLLLGAAITRRLLALRRDLRLGAPGAKLTRRLLFWLFVLALPPLLLVFLFASRFIAVTVDSWLQVNAGEVLEAALLVGRADLDQRVAAVDRDLDRVIKTLHGAEREQWTGLAEAALDEGRFAQLSAFDASGRLLMLAAADPDWVSAEPPDEDIQLALGRVERHAQAEPWRDGLRVRVVKLLQLGEQRVLVQGFAALPEAFASSLIRIENGIAEVRRARFLRDSLKLAFVLVLSFVLLLSVLLVILLALELSRRLVAPIGRLQIATRSVSEGHYDQRLPEVLDDELGFLLRSFNHMLRELELASARARSSQAETERQRAFLETVLGRLSSAVIVIDEQGILRGANPAASALLGETGPRQLGQPLAEWRRSHPPIRPVIDLLLGRLREDAREFRDELVLDVESGRQLWLARGARLPDGGLVAVFDDTTEIDRARRDAAWGEVARRLAHEVKNPLTPIQLAAERLRRRVLPTLPEAEAEVLDRATHTIVAQVDALKTLVNAFGEYARAPQLQRKPLQLAALVDELIELYAGDASLQLRSALPADLPTLDADAGRLRQVLHNLIKNAQEAGAGASPVVAITIGASRLQERGRSWVELWVEDDGPGLPAGFDASWFEPYRTTKAKGTGLGLAIVRKIAEEHGGSLQAVNRTPRGARFSLRLPA